jgi:hypothetical protein
MSIGFELLTPRTCGAVRTDGLDLMSPNGRARHTVSLLKHGERKYIANDGQAVASDEFLIPA